MDNSAILDRYYNLSLRYLSYRPRSEKEIIDYLKKKQFRKPELNDEMIAEIISKLYNYNFLDDENFTKAFVNERRRIKNKPTRVIRYELKHKGIKDETINKYLENEGSKESDLDSAKVLADKKMKFYRNLDEYKRREKVLAFLVRKGFSYDIAKKALKD